MVLQDGVVTQTC